MIELHTADQCSGLEGYGVVSTQLLTDGKHTPNDCYMKVLTPNESNVQA